MLILSRNMDFYQLRVITPGGKPYRRYAPTLNPADLENDIRELLAN
jgi:hypothetical protein